MIVTWAETTIQSTVMGHFQQTGGQQVWRPTCTDGNRQYRLYSASWGAWVIGPNASSNLAGVASVSGTVPCPSQAAPWYAWSGSAWASSYEILGMAEHHGNHSGGVPLRTLLLAAAAWSVRMAGPCEVM